MSKELPQTRYAGLARVAIIRVRPVTMFPYGRVALISAGTADLSVAEKCAEVLCAFGLDFERLYDVSVAWLYWLLAQRAVFDQAALAIVVAGMEGPRPAWLED